MFRIKQLIIIFLATFILGGSVGINVFKHICSKDGVSVRYLFNTNSHCEEEELMACHAESSNLPSCCQPEKKKEKDDCCSDEIDHFQLKIDYAPQDDVQTSAGIDIIEPATIIVSSSKKPVLYHDKKPLRDTDPPPKEARRYRSFLQVYTI